MISFEKALHLVISTPDTVPKGRRPAAGLLFVVFILLKAMAGPDRMPAERDQDQPSGEVLLQQRDLSFLPSFAVPCSLTYAQA